LMQIDPVYVTPRIVRFRTLDPNEPPANDTDAPASGATVTIELLRRQKVVRQVTAQAPAGACVISLSLKHVRRGRYTLQVVATDAGGASSDPVVVQLRIVP